MEYIGKNIFRVGENCFNKKTLEVFSLEPKYLNVLRRIIKDEPVSKKSDLIRKEIERSGILSAETSSSGQSDFSPNFVAFRIVLGEICNLRCRNCFVLKREHSGAVMDKPFLEKIIAKTFSFGKNRMLKYHFFGGEPTAMPDLLKFAVDMVRFAAKKGQIIDPIITITTNGTLIDENLASFFRENMVQVGVSVDGPREKNDSIRGKGTFDRIMNSFRLLEKYDVERWFLVTPYFDILEEIPDFIESLHRDFSLKSVTFNTPFEGESLKWAVDGKCLADMILKSYERAKKLGLNIESAASPVLYALSERVTRSYPCSISGNDVMASISPDGRISFCAQYWGEDIFAEQFCSNYQLYEEATKVLACSSCIAEHICGGPCPVQFRKTGLVDQNKCRFYQQLLQKFLENPACYVSDDQMEEILLK